MREDADAHVALAGEAAPDEWAGEVRRYWRRHAEQADPALRERYTQFALLGILPDWAAGEEAAPVVPDARRRLARAADPGVPHPERVSYYEEDPVWAVRVAALLNPATPPAIREHHLARTSQSGKGEVLLGRWRWYELSRGRRSVRAGLRSVLLDLVSQPEAAAELPLAAFGALLRSPSLLHDPPGARDRGECWPRLLGWGLGVRPAPGGVWGRRSEAGLRSLAEDGNRWVRAAARQRRDDPGGAPFTW